MPLEAQILQELMRIRWIATAAVLVVVLLAAVFCFYAIFMFRLRRARSSSDFYELGNALLLRGEVDSLLSMCEEHLREFPGDASAYWLKANAHYRRREWSQALISYRRTNELQPGWSLATTIAELEAKVEDSPRGPDLRVVVPPPRNDKS